MTSDGEDDSTSPHDLSDPVWTANDAISALRIGELAVREAVDRMTWVITKLIGNDNVQLAAVLDARSAEMKRCAQMMGMSATDVQLSLGRTPGAGDA